MASVMPAELRLVYASACGEAGTPLLTALLHDPLDWHAVAVLADQERAVPAVLEAVQTLRPDLRTDPALETLRRLAMVAMFESARLETKLARLLEAFEAERIPLVLLKGAGIALQRRGTLRGRPMRDLDVLLDPADVHRAFALARTLGWIDSRYAGDAPFYEVAAHLAPLEDDGGSQLQLELHSDLFFAGHPFGLTAAMVRAQAVPVTWRGHRVGVPDQTRLILHAALHASWSHALRGAWWRSWHDVAPLLPTSDEGWTALTNDALAARAGTSLYWLLRLGRALTGMAVPETVLATLGVPIPALLRPLLFAHITGDACALVQSSPSVKLNKLAWRLALQPVASGHGAQTPWQYEALGGFSSHEGEALSPMRKLQYHLRRWRVYLSYGRRVILR